MATITKIAELTSRGLELGNQRSDLLCRSGRQIQSIEKKMSDLQQKLTSVQSELATMRVRTSKELKALDEQINAIRQLVLDEKLKPLRGKSVQISNGAGWQPYIEGYLEDICEGKNTCRVGASEVSKLLVAKELGIDV